jgi:hypothetical protein
MSQTNNLNIEELRTRSLALGIDEQAYVINLDINDSFGYILMPYTRNNITLILDYNVLLNSDMDIQVPKEILLVHVINYNCHIKMNCRLLHEESTIILYHKDKINNLGLNSVKYLNYSTLLTDGGLRLDEVDTFYLNVLDLIGKERKYLKKVFSQITKVKKLVLHVNEYDYNSFGDGCDVFAMLEFMQHHLSQYMATIQKLKIKYNIEIVELQVSLSQYTRQVVRIGDSPIQNYFNYFLTEETKYDKIAFKDKYNVDECDVKSFIENVLSIEEALNKISTDIFVNFLF